MAMYPLRTHHDTVLLYDSLPKPGPTGCDTDWPRRCCHRDTPVDSWYRRNRASITLIRTTESSTRDPSSAFGYLIYAQWCSRRGRDRSAACCWKGCLRTLRDEWLYMCHHKL
ncbi:hypothetical protein DOTSEDRAFT_83208 [Dothistroma septosporum NZE10]|uniref:Uncharacterized protein n=1 Tax=Dothistroma septosporum (strain NZE10 / CBS 128990) TaxID=675120 RepID=M2YKI7_DOTSN|nr:hypothetical protein DOTSEDRAFT_83208 [Dothistroma septosporum NZE10]